jgi:hypothetical protein
MKCGTLSRDNKPSELSQTVRNMAVGKEMQWCSWVLETATHVIVYKYILIVRRHNGTDIWPKVAETKLLPNFSEPNNRRQMRLM